MSRWLLAAAAAWLAAPPASGHPTAGEPRIYEVRRDASDVFVVTHRKGLLSFLGHEHAITPTEWSAELCLDDPLTAGASGSVVVETASLQVDTDSARALADLGEGPGAEDRATIRERMLDADHLYAERFPEVRLDMVATGGLHEGGFRARGTITVRDVTRVVDVPVRLERGEAGDVTLSGTLRLRQSTFGIDPESVAGVVKVADEVDLHVRLTARATERNCERAPAP